jgi:hypothetical protein
MPARHVLLHARVGERLVQRAGVEQEDRVAGEQRSGGVDVMPEQVAVAHLLQYGAGGPEPRRHLRSLIPPPRQPRRQPPADAPGLGSRDVVDRLTVQQYQRGASPDDRACHRGLLGQGDVRVHRERAPQRRDVDRGQRLRQDDVDLVGRPRCDRRGRIVHRAGLVRADQHEPVEHELLTRRLRGAGNRHGQDREDD